MFEVGLGHAVGDVAGVGRDIAFQIVAGAAVDLIRHSAPQQQVALAAEIEHLRVGQRRLAVACVIGFVVAHLVLLSGFGVPANLSQLHAFENTI